MSKQSHCLQQVNSCMGLSLSQSAFFLFFLCAVLGNTHVLQAQNTRSEQQAQYRLKVAKTSEKIRIDGDLSESVWQTAEVAGDFWLKWPRDGAPAPEQTEVRCAYDDKFLYIAFVCRDTTPKYVIQNLKRDAEYWDSDGCAVVLDPSNSAVNGFFFGVSPAGVQTEALLSTGNEEMDTNWDNIWFVETKTYPDRWTAEYAIPFRILRFKEGQTNWGINFIRNDLTNGVYSLWARIPFQFDGTDLGWTGALAWDEAPKHAKGNYNIAPYVTTGLNKDYEDGTDWKARANAGADAKIGIGSGMNLDLTLNPDFSQVEIDQQVINLTRFDVMLPERRTFFLENADLYGNFGIPPIRPFFSRRIGLNEDGEQVPILGGARLTGNLNSDTRLGIMNMQTRAKGADPARNFTALALNRRLFGRTNVSGYFLNRETFAGNERMKEQFSRNAGAEFLYTSTDGRWTASASHHRSFKPNIENKNWWGNAGFSYTSRKFNFLLDFLHMEPNYYADMGFEQRIENYDFNRDTTLRIGYNFIYSEIGYLFFPKKKTSKINFIEVEGELFNVINPGGGLNEATQEWDATFSYKNTSELKLVFTPSWANVPVSFKFDDEESEDCPALPAGFYRFANAAVEWTSDSRKPFFMAASGSGGTFYNGKQYAANLEFTYRLQPIMNLSMGFEYNKLDFPAPYCSSELFNITPRVEIFFKKNLWWTTFIQYNNQSDNFNINSRLQWRYRPMSDLFLVYTDNYAVKFWGPKNRALVLKASYWL
jgi:Domain of unknown function (DUF5916)/Carbohydrate family 9 binding domain-like